MPHPFHDLPADLLGQSAAVQCAAGNPAAMADTRSAAQPTRSASTGADSTSPVCSTTPARSRPLAQAVRAVSSSPSGSFRLTGTPLSRPWCCHPINDTP
ncbi:hypothetical protein [Streptomyces sp. NPDC002845]